MKGEIVKLVKFGQCTAPMWQQAWLNYISMNGNGNSDPAEYDEKFLCDFLNCGVLAGSMEMGGGMQSSSGTSADTSIGKCSKEPMGVGTRDSQKDDLLPDLLPDLSHNPAEPNGPCGNGGKTSHFDDPDFDAFIR